MSDLAYGMLQWAFSTVGIIHLVGVGILVGAAIWFSRSQSVGRFCLVGSALWIAVTALGALNSSTPRVALAFSIWALSTILIYSTFFAVLVAKGKGPRLVIVTAAILFMLQTPLSLLSGIFFACFIGHDCP